MSRSDKFFVVVLSVATIWWATFGQWNYAAASGFATIVLLLMGIEEQL